MLSKIWTVFEFEFRRTLTWQRSLMAFALAMFPVFMIALVQYQGAHLQRDDRGEIGLFILIPGVTCVMGLLLWATGADARDRFRKLVAASKKCGFDAEARFYAASLEALDGAAGGG